MLIAMIVANEINYTYLPTLIGHLAGLTHLRATQCFTESLATVNLTPKQAIALEFIAHNPTISQRAIAEHIGTTPTVLVGVLDALTARGLVQRIRSSEDRRRHSVQVTEAGRDTCVDVATAALQVEETLRKESGLDSAEWQTLTKLMQKLSHRAVATTERME